MHNPKDRLLIWLALIAVAGSGWLLFGIGHDMAHALPPSAMPIFIAVGVIMAVDLVVSLWALMRRPPDN